MNLTRAALYIRVSNEEQVKEGYSLQAQKDNLVKVAKENGYLIVDTYTDEGITARKKYTKRKEFMRLISDVEAKKIDIILFIKLDRWFRNVADYYKIQEILDRNNVNWRATTENYDTTTANGRLYINIRLAVAQDEADRTSERIKFVFEKKVKEGEVISGNIPKGYRIKDKHLIIDEKEAELIRYIFNTYLILKSKRATMLQTTKDFGKHYSYNFVCRTLEREMYTGKYRNNTNFCRL